MITTKNDEIADFINSFRDHGKSHKKILNYNSKSTFKYVHDSLGLNYRLTEIQSAIGRIQLSKLSEWTKIRERNALKIANYLKPLDTVRIPLPEDGIRHAWYKFYAYLKPECLSDGWNRDRIISELNNKGIPAFSGSCSEVYLEKCFANDHKNNFNRLPTAKSLGDNSLMFLVHPTIDIDSIELYANSIYKILKTCKR